MVVVVAARNSEDEVEGFEVESGGEELLVELLAERKCRSLLLLALEPPIPPPPPPLVERFTLPPLPLPPEDDEIVVSRFFRSFQQDSDSKICESLRESTSSPLNMTCCVVPECEMWATLVVVVIFAAWRWLYCNYTSVEEFPEHITIHIYKLDNLITSRRYFW